MLSETNKPAEGEIKHRHKSLDREVRDMVHAITDRITDHIHKPGGSSQHHIEDHEDDGDHGIRIITLAGTNAGANMRTELDDKKSPLDDLQNQQENEPFTTYVNSNFQAINNSIMLGGSYTTNDPGVHLDISDVYEPRGHRLEKTAKKGKKKDKDSVESDHHSEFSRK